MLGIRTALCSCCCVVVRGPLVLAVASCSQTPGVRSCLVFAPPGFLKVLIRTLRRTFRQAFRSLMRTLRRTFRRAFSSLIRTLRRTFRRAFRSLIRILRRTFRRAFSSLIRALRRTFRRAFSGSPCRWRLRRLSWSSRSASRQGGALPLPPYRSGSSKTTSLTSRTS